MKFKPLLPDSQYIQYQNWHIIHSPALSLNWLQELLELSLPSKKDDERVLKLESSGLILKLDSDIGCLAAKHYRKLTIKRILRNSIEHTRAHRSWCYAHFLLAQSLNTPEPLAFIEERRMGLRCRSWYISRFEESIRCDKYYAHSQPISSAMENSATAIVNMFIHLRECQLSHGDFKATNLLMPANNPSMIDLDSMKYHSNEKTAERLWRRDIIRFMDNWRDRLDIYTLFKLAFLKRGIEIP